MQISGIASFQTPVSMQIGPKGDPLWSVQATDPNGSGDTLAWIWVDGEICDARTVGTSTDEQTRNWAEIDLPLLLSLADQGSLSDL